MRTHLRSIPTIALLAALVGACGGTPGTQNPAATTAGTQNPAGTTAPVAEFEGLGTELLAPIFGVPVPTPVCDARMDGNHFCRWTSADGATVLDVEESSDYATVDEWRTAFGTAGFEEEIPGIGAAALGGDNPLADGFRASTYTSTGTAFTVTVNKAGDPAAVKALVIAILGALAS